MNGFPVTMLETWSKDDKEIKDRKTLSIFTLTTEPFDLTPVDGSTDHLFQLGKSARTIFGKKIPTTTSMSTSSRRFFQLLKNWQDGYRTSALPGRVHSAANIPLEEIEDMGEATEKKTEKTYLNTDTDGSDTLKNVVVSSPLHTPLLGGRGENKNVTIAGEVCHMRESPYRIHKMAEIGYLSQVQRLYLADPTRLHLRDPKGRTVMHAAASHNHVNVLQFCLEHGAVLDDQDILGNTPMHLAVENEALEALDFLLINGSNSRILNEKQQAPIHLATELNKVTVIKGLVKHKDKIDVMQGGEHGRTALHLAAMYDYAECAEILVSEYKCCAKKPCRNGYYPIHEAAKNASARTLEVLLQWGESIGCDRRAMISLHDVEGNDPLHSAVNGGDIKAVKLCLENGAKISSQQHNLSTPVHLACSQGALDIIRLMFSMQPDEKLQVLSTADVQKMTPLHCAAMFDHTEIVKYLVGEGAGINAVDKEMRTPLLLSASRAGWRTAKTLMSIGADTTIKDFNNRNVLHFIVMHGGCLEEFAILMQQLRIPIEDKLNEKDLKGCTPMHYASRDGYFRSIESLIKLGARINMKDNDHQSPLHFAARYGRYNTVRHLLCSDKGPFIINETDGTGLTALHIASENGHTRVVQLLLDKGALLHKDHHGRTPFHLAAENGYTQTMELLLCIHSHLLDQIDKYGNTALHSASKANKAATITYLLDMNCKFVVNSQGQTAMDIAILFKHHEATMALATHDTRWAELMGTVSHVFCCTSQALIAQMPDVFMAVLHKCITYSDSKKESKDYFVKYDFRLLQWSKNNLVSSTQYDKNPEILPLPALNTMVENRRVELLTHPVSQRYLNMKWHAYGMQFHLINLFIYMIFLTLVTTFATRLMSIHRKSIKSAAPYEYNASAICYAIATIITVFAVASGLKEMFQLYHQRMKYLLDPINLLEWILYISSVVMILPVYYNTIHDYEIVCSSLAVFLAWFNFLLYLQRFDRVGIYVVMFLEILKTLIKVLLLFSILIIAFSLAFYILMYRGENDPSYSNIPLSLMRVFSMMLGEIDYLGTYANSLFNTTSSGDTSAGKYGKGSVPEHIAFSTESFLFLAVFMVLMPILLMNLLIGLAVGDIEAVRRNAQLKRIAMQVELHTELERKLPRIVLDKVDKEEVIDYPNSPNHCPNLWFWLNKYIGTTPTECSSVADRPSEPMQEEELIYEELCKQKNRMKDMQKVLDLQHQLLRLIIQKMEIKTEADDFDEGVDCKSLRPMTGKTTGFWKSPNFYRRLKTSLAFAQYKKSIDKSD